MRSFLSCVAAYWMLCTLMLSGCFSNRTANELGQPAAEPSSLRDTAPLQTEPNYTDAPSYALLISGIEAKSKFWLALDGDTVYVDRNADGKLDPVGEKINAVWSEGGSSNGATQFDLGGLGNGSYVLRLAPPDLDSSPAGDSGVEKVRLDQGWKLASLQRVDNQDPRPIGIWLSPQRQNAVATYVGGRLEFGRVSDDSKLRRSSPTKFDVKIGVRELLDAQTGRTIFPVLLTREIPEDLAPVARFTFLHEDPTQPPIETEVTLDQRC